MKSLCKKHYWKKNSFAREFLEIVEIRVVDTRVKKKLEETVVKTMGELVKTIGKIVTLKFVDHPSNHMTSLETVIV